jgi:hypothetical protein
MDGGVTWMDVLQAVAALATAVGVLLAWRQLSAQREQSRVDFEDMAERGSCSRRVRLICVAGCFRKASISTPVHVPAPVPSASTTRSTRSK